MIIKVSKDIVFYRQQKNKRNWLVNLQLILVKIDMLGIAKVMII